MNNYSLELKDICFKIGPRTILKNINLKVKSHSIHGFLGPNGAGKSTTMRIIAGVVSASSGDVLLCGKLMNPSAYELKNKIGYLPENPPLYDDMRVDEYLDFMGRLRGISRKEIKQAVEKSLDKLKIRNVKKRVLANLSRGYRQRVGFAQAIIHNPEFILLDEPALGLDPHAIVDMRILIKDLAREHTVLLSSHQLHEVDKICDEVSFIKDGEILVSGNLLELKKEISGEYIKILVKVMGINDSLVMKMRGLAYVHSIKVQELKNELNFEITNTLEFRKKLVEDLVKYGGTPIEVQQLDNLEHYFLERVATK